MTSEQSATYAIEESYFSALDDVISTAVRNPDATQLSILGSARGAFPSLVMERIRSLGEYGFEEDRLKFDGRSSLAGPELHPLDFEWYFTSDCADRLAQMLTNQPGDILCLAAPTLANAIALRGRKVVLLDNNPLIRLRLAKATSNLQLTICDLYTSITLDKSFDVVFFDSPWYVEPISYWLWQASNFVVAGGTIAFTLFHSLVRPGADDERNYLLAQAKTIGDVRILKNVLSYETPLFEQEALAQSGIRITGSWRQGDLVLVRPNRRPKLPPPKMTISADEWDSFLIGSQVVKLRKRTRFDDSFFLAPVDDGADYIFPSVSMRDPRRSQIDLWTSRNRVAKVGKRSLVAHALGCLAKSSSLTNTAESTVFTSVDLDYRELLLNSLSMVLGLFPEERNGPTHNRPAFR